MNAANLPPASVLRPELRARLERLEHLERRERQGRYARWHVPAPVERESEGWLLTYLDLITLLLVMLVVMLAFSQPKTPTAEAATAAAVHAEAPGTAHPGEGNSPHAESGTPDPSPAAPAAPSAPAHAGASIPAPHSPLPAMPDTPHEISAALPGSAVSLSASSSTPSAVPDGPIATSNPPELAAIQETTGDQAGLPPGAPGQDDAALQVAGMPDRPAPVDVALVGSVRSYPSLQTALPFSFDLEGMPAGPAKTPNVLPEVAAAALPADAVQVPAPAQASPPAVPPAPADVPGGNAEPAAAPPASLEALGLNELGDNIDVIVNEESVSFRINNEILFTSGQADLMPSGLEVLTRLAGVLARNDYQIAVEGHTDPIPIQNDRFPSNWELSTGRATSVLRHLHSQGIPASRLRATGYADTKPIAPNDSPAGRAFNRRVELIMEMPRGTRRTTPQSSSSTSADGALSLSGSSSTGPIVRLR